MADKIVVKQLRSAIGCTERQRLTLKGLGLKRIGHSVELPDNLSVRGMVVKVQHLISVSVQSGAPKLTGARHRVAKKN